MGRVEDFVSSLSRYAHMLGFPVNVEFARIIEEAQDKIIEEVKGEALKYESLRDFIAALDSRGFIARASVEVSKALNEDIEDYERALKAVLTGDLGVKGARSVLLVIQAIARAYAEELLKEGMVIETSAYCPVCSAISETMLREGGSYYMVCHFCAYKWLVFESKPICPYCGNQDELSIGIIMDNQQRVALMKCWKCGSSWRIIMDESIRAPLILKPLIAMAAEKLRNVLSEVERTVRGLREGESGEV